jgi:hypothetical protein
VCPMLIVSLDCPYLIVPSVFSNVYLSCVLCSLCYQCLWIVHTWVSLRFSLTFFYFVQTFLLWYIIIRECSWNLGKYKQNPKITSKHISREITATVNLSVCVCVNLHRLNVLLAVTGNRTLIFHKVRIFLNK